MKYEDLRYKTLSISATRAFTTEPKIPKKRGNWRSIEDAKAFMYSLFQKNLRKCSYETLVFEFINFFGSNDTRTVERYLGRPEQVEKHAGSTKVIRMERMSGKIAQFQYFNERRLKAKKGLLDSLGWIMKLKEGTVLINHEVMSYCTKQVSLDEPLSPHSPLSRSYDERLEISKDNVCVSSLLDKENNQGILQGKELEKTVLEVVSAPSIKTIEKEEEVIDSTHTYKYGVNYASKHTRYALTPEELAILTAKPGEEPDRSKPIRRVSDE